MLCCQDCNIQTESTFNTVIFIDHSYNQLQNKLQHYAQKYQKRMQTKKNNEKEIQSAGNKQNLLNINQTHRKSAVLDIPTQRKITAQKPILEKQTKSTSPNGQTGRARKIIQTPKYGRNSQGKNMQSKTTSFSSLASRSSNCDFHRERELIVLKHELDKLCQEENALLRSKLQKEYLYKQELFRMNGKREQLKRNSNQRQRDLLELKKLLLKHKAAE